MTFSAPPGPPVRVLGVDDWNWKKGRRYGTILVDLERHTIIDLLPDRSSATFARWLRAHPSVRIISRDRGTEYAAAARQAAPHALQIADRFHLVRNLVQALELLLARCAAELRPAYPERASQQDPLSTSPPRSLPHPALGGNSLMPRRNASITPAKPSGRSVLNTRAPCAHKA